MEPRYIIRHPHILTSPKELAHALGKRTRVARPGHEAWFGRDFFMHYPSPNVVRGNVQEYQPLWEFFDANKRDQRRILARQGLPVPTEAGVQGSAPPYVVRPLRHQGGHGWRITDQSTDYHPAREYITSLFPKTHEYRLIFVLGKPIIFLKKVSAGDRRLRADEPWNHGNTNFSTIPAADWPRSNLRTSTNCFDALVGNPVLQHAHYVGVDILYHGPSHVWTVCEFNSCPALTIPENRLAVVDAIRGA